MAVVRKQNVIIVSADNDVILDSIKVCGILYIPGSGSPSIAIKADASASGQTLWECSGANRLFEEVEINLASGAHIDLAGTGTLLYLYLE